jgi:hypothetical protein
MSDETVMDMSLDTRTILPADFTCESQMLILSPNLIKLPDYFLYKNTCVKTLDMSKCINITIIQYNFCNYSSIKNIIWPPNIINIRDKCLKYNIYIQIINLSYCNKLKEIEHCFCENTNIVEIILPISIQRISYGFLYDNKTITYLDLSYCINLTYIDSGFCGNTNIHYIKFPKPLQTMLNRICYESYIYELDFSECKNVKIHIYNFCTVETLKLYSIDSIDTLYKILYKIQCKNLHICNITKTKELDLSFIKGLNNVYLPEGEYYIKDSHLDVYSNVTFWLQSSAHPAKYFSTLQRHLPVLETIKN